jgi:hypothetical protein
LWFDLAAGRADVLLKITRGLGGRKGIIILIATGLTGVVLLLLVIGYRQQVQAPEGVITAQLPPEQVLRLRDQARGPMPDLTYKPGDIARVAAFAVAQRADGGWGSLASGTILQVASTRVQDGGTWVTGTVQDGGMGERVTVHGTFLERYLPVVLDQTIEFSDMRLWHLTDTTVPKMSVTGWLRNITSDTISQCEVTCVFYDKNGQEIDVQRSASLTLPPFQLTRFETGQTEKEKEFTRISVQIVHATPDGLRDYLSTIDVQHTSLLPAGSK